MAGQPAARARVEPPGASAPRQRRARWLALRLLFAALGALGACGCAAVAGSVALAAIATGAAFAYGCYDPVFVTVWAGGSQAPRCDASVVASHEDSHVDFTSCHYAALDPGAWTVEARLPGFRPAQSQVVVGKSSGGCRPAVHDVLLTLEDPHARRPPAPAAPLVPVLLPELAPPAVERASPPALGVGAPSPPIRAFPTSPLPDAAPPGPSGSRSPSHPSSPPISPGASPAPSAPTPATSSSPAAPTSAPPSAAPPGSSWSPPSTPSGRPAAPPVRALPPVRAFPPVAPR